MAKSADRTDGGLAWRGMVAWRTVLATVANYGLAALFAAALARGLPHLGMSRAEAVTGGTLFAILAMPITPIFVFASRSVWTVTGFMAASAAILALITLLLGPSL